MRVKVGRSVQDVPVLDIGQGRHGAYLERDETAFVIAGSYTPDELASITSNIEG